MKFTVINGCHENSPLTEETLSRFRSTLMDATWINLAENRVRHCIGCDACQTVHPGLCGIKDGQNENLRSFMNSDVAVIITPVRFGCCNALTKDFIDRTEPLFLPFQTVKHKRTVMKPRYDSYPDQVWIGILDPYDGDGAALFETFVETCNLTAACDHTSVTTIRNRLDLETALKLLPGKGKNIS